MVSECVKKVVCPYCGSNDVKCIGTKGLECISDDTVVSDREYYLCRKCDGSFKIRAAYRMVTYIATLENGSEIDYDIVKE